jgi:hypothetical protein
MMIDLLLLIEAAVLCVLVFACFYHPQYRRTNEAARSAGNSVTPRTSSQPRGVTGFFTEEHRQ